MILDIQVLALIAGKSPGGCEMKPVQQSLDRSVALAASAQNVSSP
jgi:hypothetical protein